MTNTKYCFLFLFLMFSMFAFAQNTNDALSIPEQNGIKYRVDERGMQTRYDQTFLKEYGYLTGKENYKFYSFNQSNPYFESGIVKAVVYTNGRAYGVLSILYDMLNDEMINITRIGASDQKGVVLNKILIDSVLIQYNNQAINFNYCLFVDSNQVLMSNGYYEKFLIGDMIFYLQHTSRLFNSQGVDEFKYSARRYIVIEGNCYKLDTKKQLLNLFPTQKKHIKNLIKQQPNSYRKSDKAQTIAILKNLASN